MDAEDLLLGDLAAATAQVAAAQARQVGLVALARAAGASWADIADAVGTSTQAAWRRWHDVRIDEATGTTWREPRLPL